MPPKAGVGREDVLQAGVRLVRRDGWGAVNARAVAGELGCSTQPVFRVYKNMEELRRDLRLELDKVYAGFMEPWLLQGNRLLGEAKGYVAFARAERHIFNALFMNLTLAGSSLEDILAAEWNRASIEDAARVAGLPLCQAEKLFLHVWLYSHGVATQIVSNQIDLPEERVGEMLEEVFWKFAERRDGHAGKQEKDG